jgi:hypothetical protein
MKTFTLFWLTGKSEIVEGNDIAQAMTLAGYSNGAVRALDFYAKGDQRDRYAFDSGAKSWEPTTLSEK